MTDDSLGVQALLRLDHTSIIVGGRMLIRNQKETRRSAGLSRRALAERVGVDVAAIERIKRGVDAGRWHERA